MKADMMRDFALKVLEDLDKNDWGKKIYV
jgi:hypothetical protein